MAKKIIKNGNGNKKFLIFFVSFFFLFVSFLFFNSKINFLNFSNLFCFNFFESFNFPLEDVILVGRKRTDKKLLFKKINLKKGTNIFSIDLKKLHQKIIETSWIKDAVVKRYLNGLISIVITEREPIAIYYDKNCNSYSVVDEFGYIINSEISNDLVNLPMISGNDANLEIFNFLKIIKDFPELYSQIHMLAYIQKRRWNLKLKNDLEVKLPEDNVKEALEILQKIINDTKINFDFVSVIDLRLPKKIILKINKKK